MDTAASQGYIQDEMSDAIIGAAEALVTRNGAGGLTVRDILRALGITNRVFYNRFRNVDDVLSVVYRNTVLKVRESILAGGDIEGDFFAYVTDVVTNTLIISYDTKMRFNQYVFENDSLNEQNYIWWKTEIARLIDYAKDKKLVKASLDTDAMSYAVWCFIRGYNADAVGRGLDREEAIRRFRYSFGILLAGMKEQN